MNNHTGGRCIRFISIIQGYIVVAQGAPKRLLGALSSYLSYFSYFS